MEALLESILKSAINRMPERLLFETKYSNMSYMSIKVLSYYIRSFIAEDMVADPNVMLQSMPFEMKAKRIRYLEDILNEQDQAKEQRRRKAQRARKAKINEEGKEQGKEEGARRPSTGAESKEGKD